VTLRSIRNLGARRDTARHCIPFHLTGNVRGMKRAWAIAAVLAASSTAGADIPATTVGNANVVSADHPITVTTPGERSSQNIQFLAGLTGAGLVLVGLGVFYNLDSRSSANAVSAGDPTGQPWTSGDQADFDHTHQLAVRAGVCYGIGGAVLIGALVTWILTAPSDQVTVIQPHVTPTVTPAPGGALLGGQWRF
jgi:hypothetical protein